MTCASVTALCSQSPPPRPAHPASLPLNAYTRWLSGCPRRTPSIHPVVCLLAQRSALMSAEPTVDGGMVASAPASASVDGAASAPSSSLLVHSDLPSSSPLSPLSPSATNADGTPLSPGTQQKVLVREMQRERKRSMVLVDGWIDVQEKVTANRHGDDCRNDTCAAHTAGTTRWLHMTVLCLCVPCRPSCAGAISSCRSANSRSATSRADCRTASFSARCSRSSPSGRCRGGQTKTQSHKSCDWTTSDWRSTSSTPNTCTSSTCARATSNRETSRSFWDWVSQARTQRCALQFEWEGVERTSAAHSRRSSRL